MRLRVNWEGGGWESDHFEKEQDWLDKERAELETALAEAEEPHVTVALVAGDAVIYRSWEVTLKEAGFDLAGTWDASQSLELLEYAHGLYNTSEERLCLFHAAAKDEPLNGDLDGLYSELETHADNEEFDCGSVYIVASHEDLDEAYWQLFRDMVMDSTPTWLDECISREHAIQKLKDWDSCYPIQSGGKWYVTQTKWNQFDC
jgi:hypothetical protein